MHQVAWAWGGQNAYAWNRHEAWDDMCFSLNMVTGQSRDGDWHSDVHGRYRLGDSYLSGFLKKVRVSWCCDNSILHSELYWLCDAMIKNDLRTKW